MKVVGIIPARYASTRFPGKPLALIKGKPMIQRVYEQALKSKLDAVVIATDDVRIADAVMDFGGQYVMTSPNHRSGTDRCCEALDLLKTKYDAVVNIQGDEPFIDPKQIDLLVDLIVRDDTPLASLAKRIDDADELFSPNAVKVVVNQEGNAMYFSRNPIPFMRNVDRDEWLAKGRFYKHIGIYAYKADVLHQVAHMEPSALEQAESLEQLRWLENGLAIRMALSDAENISIDTPDDLHRAEQYAQTKPEIE
ncbi:MAG: 3-deoxy-manno-octulosonate cytidylyltransferase (CMP-KDO synthetase) [bacterium F082]|jgi:3-deoxy-manno-octulosonate cytidylyltransferase (CMP-KDO synthetase)|nr:MAG: 3-deoxy-manno-octulosonate cytidylyltransferase (CMP-KDO synthetase) [bacterium F082]KWW30903.1 MAG: 3-deoxy-manno-octulosonate cytidylyltransferase (CMP-KDO synthetase) [bacterium P201]